MAIFEVLPIYHWPEKLRPPTSAIVAGIGNVPSAALEVKCIKVNNQDGTVSTYPITHDNRRFTTTDPRAIRHSKADARLRLISE